MGKIAVVERFQRELSMNISSKLSNFYSVWIKVKLFSVVVIILIFGLNRVTDRTLGILLSTAFKIRYKEALTKVYTAAHITASKYLSFLTKEETNCK